MDEDVLDFCMESNYTKEDEDCMLDELEELENEQDN